MRTVYADFTLKNGADQVLARHGYKKEADIRQITVRFVVDTGADPNVITEETRERLGLPVTFQRTVTVASGEQKTYDVVGPVEIHWKNRAVVGDAVVIPGQTENLLGVATLELLDLCVNPVEGVLFGRHGDEYINMLR